MARLFHRKLSSYEQSLITPWAVGRPTQEQGERLGKIGMTPLFDVAFGAHLARFGATLAMTRVDGALWPLARAAWKDGYARWAYPEDIALLDKIAKAVTPNGVSSGELPALLEDLRRRLRDLTEGELAALEAIARLGSYNQFLRSIEEL